ncbi:hypothetical protein DF049_34015 [Burkholderia cenocepacia]|nr:hypothetical protein DF049_34015 [Burkholderia cenocepacia]
MNVGTKQVLPELSSDSAALLMFGSDTVDEPLSRVTLYGTSCDESFRFLSRYVLLAIPLTLLALMMNDFSLTAVPV